MKKATLFIFLLSSLFCYSQAKENVAICEEKFIDLNTKFFKIKDSLAKEDKNFHDLKKAISTTSKEKSYKKLTEKGLVVNVLKDSLNKLHKNFVSYKIVCLENGFTKEKIDSLYKYGDFIPFDKEKQEKTTIETEVYTYVNENQVINENFVNKNSAQGEILADVLSKINEESYFGDITIPMENQEFYFYEKPQKSLSLKISDKNFKFKKIDLEIRDGNFADIRVTVEVDNNLYIFENYISISFFRYSKKAKMNFLFYSQKQPNNIDEDILLNLRVRLSDVLTYKYKMGNNYIPNNLILELPKNDIENNKTNFTSKATYQIKQKTYLDKIIELRTYSDFLALFSDNSNGILQIEGAAKFYIFPIARQICGYSGQFELFKTVTPRIHYSRLENEDKFVLTTINNTIENSLGLIEKRFLTIGTELNLIEIYHKNYPMKANLFSTVDYNVTQVENNNQTIENLKALGYGFGLNISSKRFNNFGFTYKFAAKWFDYENYNNSDVIDTNFKVPVLKNQAEIFYHPTDNPNQAIFTRLTTYNYMGKSSNQSFYQFQFGYKFSIGSRAVKQ